MADDHSELDTINQLDLERYQGLWYEVARLPNSFQTKCAGDVTAKYSVLASGKVEVINSCRFKNGQIKSSKGEARQPDPQQPGKLEVRFAPAWLSWLSFVWGDYYLIGLDENYQWALIGEPSRKNLWLLARSPDLADDQFEHMIAQAQRQGYDTAKVERTEHSAQ